jgi:predicted nucleic acid-binding protein
VRRPADAVGPRESPALPKLGTAVPLGPVLLDTNVFIDALAGRGPRVLCELLQAVPRLFMAAPVRAELAWVRGRLAPARPGTPRALATYAALL